MSEWILSVRHVGQNKPMIYIWRCSFWHQTSNLPDSRAENVLRKKSSSILYSSMCLSDHKCNTLGTLKVLFCWQSVLLCIAVSNTCSVKYHILQLSVTVFLFDATDVVGQTVYTLRWQIYTSLRCGWHVWKVAAVTVACTQWAQNRNMIIIL